MENFLIQKEINKYKTALALEKLVKKNFRTGFKNFILIVLIFLGALYFVSIMLDYPAYSSASVKGTAFSLWILDNLDIIRGFLFVFTGIWIISFLIESFFNSFYFKGFKSSLKELEIIGKEKVILDYESADVLSGKEKDLTRLFFNSKYGLEAKKRLDVDKKGFDEFLKNKTTSLDKNFIEISTETSLTLEKIALFIYQNDSELQKFLFDRGISEETYKGSVFWVSRSFSLNKQKSRWWGKDNLGRIQGIAKDWAFGGAYKLARYSRDVTNQNVFSYFSKSTDYFKEKVDELEMAIARSAHANAILVGDPGVGKMDIVLHLASEISSGRVLSPIEHKRMLIFDFEAFIAVNSTKAAFEYELITMLNEAIDSGNIILVMNKLAQFLQSAKSLGSDAASIMEPYVSSRSLQVIALSDLESYRIIEDLQPSFLSRFEEIKVESSDVSSTITLLEDMAETLEKSYKIIFTYPAISAVAENAERYFVSGVMPNKAVTLLQEIIPFAKAYKTEKITKNIVDDYVSQKIGVNIGEVREEEKGVLLNLEEILHQRVVGQEPAIIAISGAMRRARAGIQNPNRPLGSFLFLGPTGVGKTETAKALSQVFFGDEKRMLRLDMSEFSGANALERIIGSFDAGAKGALAKLLRDKPFGVLLLDEFEKTTEEVLNLFLQVIDEGFFTDVKGKKISARNVIIIATSNAGSDLIWQFLRKGKDLINSKDQIIDKIISQGTFRPELINRFDGVVLFKPLQENDLKIIAALQLKKLKGRINKKGYNLVVNNILIDILVKEGFDPQFGARPMIRVLQDRIEEKIAQKIISGSLTRGSDIEFTEEDFR